MSQLSVYNEDECVATSKVFCKVHVSLSLKLDSKTKEPRGGSSIQCRGHQAVRYMSYIPQGWFVLMEKQWSRMIVWDNLIVWDFQVWSATTIYPQVTKLLTTSIPLLLVKKKKKCTSLALKRKRCGFTFLVNLVLILDHNFLLPSTEKIYFMVVSGS